MKRLLFFTWLFAVATTFAQTKKPLDHSVYDGWKSLGERMISNDGNYIVYTVNPQEGDGELVIQNPSTQYKKVIARGYGAVITEDSRYLVFKIKPFYQDTRQARIKKKRPDDMPRDSLAVIELGQDSVLKIARVKFLQRFGTAVAFGHKGQLQAVLIKCKVFKVVAAFQYRVCFLCFQVIQ